MPRRRRASVAAARRRRRPCAPACVSLALSELSCAVGAGELDQLEIRSAGKQGQFSVQLYTDAPQRLKGSRDLLDLISKAA